MRALALCVALGALSCGRYPQSSDCQKLTACANALKAGSGDAAYGPTYGADGTCWLTSDASQACAETCKSLTENLAKRPGAPAACK